MDILSVCAVGVIAAVIALLLRRQMPQISLLVSVGAGAILLLSVIKNIVLTVDEVDTLLSSSGISSDYIMILLKTLGICFITEFTCDTVTEAGMMSLSTNISFIGKILVIAAAFPMFSDIINIITSMVKS